MTENRPRYTRHAPGWLILNRAAYLQGPRTKQCLSQRRKARKETAQLVGGDRSNSACLFSC